MSYASLLLESPSATPELVITAIRDGKVGERVSIVVSGAIAHDAPLTISVFGEEIVVDLEGSPTGDQLGLYSVTTASQLVSALNSHPAASLLVSAIVVTPQAFVSPVLPREFLSGAGPMEVLITPLMRVDATLSASLLRAVAVPLTLAMASAMAVTQTRSIAAPCVWVSDHAIEIVATRSNNVVSTWASNFQCRLSATQSATLPSSWVWGGGCDVLATRSIFPSSTWRMGAGVSLTILKSGLTVCDVVRDILLCWGIEHPCSAPSMAKIAAMNTLNSGMQVLWNQAKDRNYWTRSTLELTFPAGTASFVLDDLIQNVIGPARLSTGEPLVPLANISESESFMDAFLEDDRRATPTGYYIARNFQIGADPSLCTLILSPAPSVNVIVRLDVVKEAPRFTILDLESCPICPIPHRYVESILMPVCRYLSMHSHLFSNREREKAIVAGYTEARALLDVADPLPGQSGENVGYRKEEREK